VVLVLANLKASLIISSVMKRPQTSVHFPLSGPDTVRGGYEQVVQGQHTHGTEELVLDPRRTSS
jgi:hypothetical protein